MITDFLRFLALVGICLGGLSGCASQGGAEVPAAGPDLTPIAGQAVTPTGHLVLTCVRQAMDAFTFDMVGDDGDSRLIRFTCRGGEAEALFNALAERSAAIGSEWQTGTVTYRSTERIERNLYGSDMCWRDADSYACQFNLNLGGFIQQ